MSPSPRSPRCLLVKMHRQLSSSLVPNLCASPGTATALSGCSVHSHWAPRLLTALAINQWGLLWDSRFCLQSKACALASEHCSCRSPCTGQTALPGVPGRGRTVPLGWRPAGSGVGRCILPVRCAQGEGKPSPAQPRGTRSPWEQRTLHMASILPVPSQFAHREDKVAGAASAPPALGHGSTQPALAPCGILATPLGKIPGLVPTSGRWEQRSCATSPGGSRVSIDATIHPLQLPSTPHTSLVSSSSSSAAPEQWGAPLGGSSKHCTGKQDQQGWEVEKRPWEDPS